MRIVDCLALETPFKISFIVCSKKLLFYDACMFAYQPKCVSANAELATQGLAFHN